MVQVVVCVGEVRCEPPDDRDWDAEKLQVALEVGFLRRGPRGVSRGDERRVERLDLGRGLELALLHRHRSWGSSARLFMSPIVPRASPRWLTNCPRLRADP